MGVSFILGGNRSIPRKPLTCRRAGLEYIYVRLRSTSMSDFYITDICTSDLCPFFNFSNRHPILKSMSFFKSSAVSHFLKSTSNDVTVYALTLILPPAINLTNKSAIDLRIWKGRRLLTVRYPWKQLILDWNNKILLYIDFIFTRSLHGIQTKYFCDRDFKTFLWHR